MELTPRTTSGGNLVIDSRKKRKFEMLDKQHNYVPLFDGIFEPNSGRQMNDSPCLLTGASNVQHKRRLCPGIDQEGSMLRVMANQSVMPCESSQEASLNGVCQFYDRSNVISVGLLKGGITHNAAVERIKNPSSETQFLALPNTKSSSPVLKTLVSDISALDVLQNHVHERMIGLDHTKPTFIAHNTPVVKDNTSGLIIEQERLSATSNSSQKPSESLESLPSSNFSLVMNQKFGPKNEHQWSCIQNFSKFKQPGELRENLQKLNALQTKNVSNARISSPKFSDCSVGMKVHELSQCLKADAKSVSSHNSVLGLDANGKVGDQICPVTSKLSVHETSCPENISSGNIEFNSKDEGSMNILSKITKSKDSTMEREQKLLPDPADNAKKHYDGDDPVFSEKTIQKLWDGLLQLNACTTVSAVAFFKSGEKSMGVNNWPSLVEVKGKVRLEAFEKYIQELPRSRNRALMVISLCWKEGSSKSGLTGLKEVAKGYRQGDKVGFAQPAPGIDLYICPSSDTIITILAKYGFFKGMTAAEGNKDSLIGCVVWRKKRSANSNSKVSDRMKLGSSDQQSGSPSGSAISQAVEVKSPKTKPDPVECSSIPSNAQQSGIPLALASDPRPLTISSETSPTPSIDKLEQVDNIQVSDVCPKMAKGVTESSVAISISEPSVPKLDSNSMQESTARIPKMSISEQKKLCTGVELLESAAVENPHERAVGLVDDDLPEFDFDIICGHKNLEDNFLLPRNESRMPDPAQIDEHVRVGIMNVGGSISHTHPLIRPNAATPNHPRLEAETSGRPQAGTHHGAFVSGKQQEHNSEASVLLGAEEKSVSAGTTITGMPTATECKDKDGICKGTNRHVLLKNLWDNDDDMPEWCPPELENRTQSVAREKATGFSNLFGVPNPLSNNLCASSSLFNTNSLSARPPLLHGFRPSLRPTTVGQHHGSAAVLEQQSIPGLAQLSQGHSHPLNAYQHSRPQHPFDARHPMKNVNWKARFP